MYAVIAENDISEWEDRTGEVYHFPKRYRDFLRPGTRVIYYKGKIQDKAFSTKRLTDAPHYFGSATIGRVYRDPQSGKGDLFADIEDFQRFNRPVLNTFNGEYIEVIPASRSSNYWRDGVRPVNAETYQKLLELGEKHGVTRQEVSAAQTNDVEQGLESLAEGGKKLVYTTKYERNPRLRRLAILIHGVNCEACGFNFEKVYGAYGQGYIHVHHIKPLAESDGTVAVNPETDLTVLCANCHAMVHRHRDRTLSVSELRGLFKA